MSNPTGGLLWHKELVRWVNTWFGLRALYFLDSRTISQMAAATIWIDGRMGSKSARRALGP